eukprot:TRINITY_DN14493_c0_g1_i1.p1 TRINITY_DN14493_c0_g1~~TRINITY_DN14493_c0_g1_i1.p1  ORF type:complete len:356 (-),score=94.55 TRINITY_DN14493_c0_g1_i1:283-1290(-)
MAVSRICKFLALFVAKAVIMASLTLPSEAVASSSSCSAGDDLLLIQKERALRNGQRRAADEGFPDLGALKNIARGIGSELPGLEGAMTAAIKDISKSINKSMDTIDEHATKLARKASAAQQRVVDSANTTLRKKISALASLVNATSENSLDLWETTSAELDTLVGVLSRGLRALGNDKLASTLTAVLHAAVERVADILSWIFDVRERSSKLALNEAARSLSDLRSTLAEGTWRVEEFVSASDASFDALAQGVSEAAQDFLPRGVMREVDGEMRNVVRRVNASTSNMRNLTANMTAELLAIVDDISSEVKALGGDRDGAGAGIVSAVKRYVGKFFR